MSSIELNKIAAAILIAALIAMLVGNFVNILYKPELDPEKRGYQIAVEDDSSDQIIAEKPASDPLENFKELMKTANAENGERLYARCQSCHTVNKGGPNRVGPNLYGVVGAKVGHIDDYNFSSALKAKERNWEIENLARFLHNPRQYLPGTKMAFAGLRNPSDIADLITYLNQNSDNPKNIE